MVRGFENARTTDSMHDCPFDKTPVEGAVKDVLDLIIN